MALEILAVILLSLLPVSELRGAIPFGMAASQLHPAVVFFTAVAANMLVIPVAFLFLDYAHHRLARFHIYKRLFSLFVERSRRKAHSYVAKYGWAGLALFVAVPLPVTGAYTGTLAAWLLGVPRRQAFAALSAGVVMAGLIVTAMTLLGFEASIFINNKLTN